MELKLDSIYRRALESSTTLSGVPLGKERIRGALKFKSTTVSETAAFLRDFASLSTSNDFSPKELAKMLENTCMETASFLFSAGAPAAAWREWCFLGGQSAWLNEDPAYSMQLISISRMAADSGLLSRLQQAELETYRAEAIRFAIFRPQRALAPSLPPAGPLDEHYAALVAALQTADMKSLADAVSRVVRFWLSETSYGYFEPGIFPVFEPEINSVVASLLVQGLELRFSNAKVSHFLEAALE